MIVPLTHTAISLSSFTFFETLPIVSGLIFAGMLLAYSIVITRKRRDLVAKINLVESDGSELPFAEPFAPQNWGMMARIEADCAIAADRFVRDLPWVEAPSPDLASEEEDPEYRDFYNEVQSLVSGIADEAELHEIIGSTSNTDVEKGFFCSRPDGWVGHLYGSN